MNTGGMVTVWHCGALAFYIVYVGVPMLFCFDVIVKTKTQPMLGLT